MEQARMFLAIALSLLVFVVWNYFFVEKPDLQEPVQEKPITQQAAEDPVEKPTYQEQIYQPSPVIEPVTPVQQNEQENVRLISVNGPLYSVKISEKRAAFQSFVLKDYTEVSGGSDLKELISENSGLEFEEFEGNDIQEAIMKASRILNLSPATLKYMEIPNNSSGSGGVFNSIFGQGDVKKVRIRVAIPESIKNQTGTVRIGFSKNSLPGLTNAIFKADYSSDDLSLDQNPQQITFTWMSPQGVVVEKVFTFYPDSYLIDLAVKIKNGSEMVLTDDLVLSLISKAPEEIARYGFEGPCTLIDARLEKVKFDDIEEKSNLKGNLRWIAVQDRYFLKSIIPKVTSEANFHLRLRNFLKLQNDRHLPIKTLEAKYSVPINGIQPNVETNYEFALYMGPKNVKLLKSFGFDLDKAINFGFFDFIAKPCLWLMNFLYTYIPNYGVAIIILTILIKILFWPLGNKSYKSMNEMKKLQPLMAEIREKYKDDKKRMNEEVMNLYKTYKINPVGGCLPMVAQIPVFFALYQMLYSAIELRHAPFFGWINDLSAPDRLFDFGIAIPFMQPPYGIPVLTIVMGATMLIQQKLTPPAGDPAQAKMMMFMPIIFTVIFINFSSGLVLYWLINNVLGIAQQYYVTKVKD